MPEVCGDGIDNDCDGEADEDCPQASTCGGAGGAPNPECSNSCYDKKSGPIDLVSGNMSFGPLTLAEVATPFGSPLKVSAAYNSKDVSGGALGPGWRLNLETRAVSDPIDSTKWHWVGEAGGTKSFASAPSFVEAPRFAAPWHSMPTSVARALDASPTGFYRAETAPDVYEARVLRDDGSTLEFTAGGDLRAWVDRYGNRQDVLPTTVGGFTMQASVAQGPRSIDVVPFIQTVTRSDGTRGPALLRADVSVRVGAAPPTTVARLLFDGEGRLTDICAPGAPPVDPSACRHGGETLPRCASEAGMHTLWRFGYQSVSGQRVLSEVRDETCNVVETHEYVDVPGLGVVATKGATARDTTELTFNGVTTRVTQFLSTSSNPNPGPADSHQAAFVVSDATIDPAVSRVSSVDETCGCGKAIERIWQKDTSGRKYISEVLTPDARRVYSRAPLTSADPYDFGLITQELVLDTSSAHAPAVSRSFSYQHPLLRRPTVITDNGSPAHSVIYDFDDDDLSFPCITGATRPASLARGVLAAPNDAPTRFLCRVLEGGGSDWRVTRYQYDAQGRVLRVEAPSGATRYSYFSDSDPVQPGMLQSVTVEGLAAPTPLTTRFGNYHFSGRARTVTSPNDEVTAFAFDDLGRETERWEPGDPRPTRTVWAATEKPLSVETPRSNSLAYQYGEFGRVVGVEKYDGAPLTSTVIQWRTFTYDKAGNAVVTADFPGGREVRRDFDEAHRVTREYSVSSAGRLLGETLFDYRHGRLVAKRPQGESPTRFLYDGFDRLRGVSVDTPGLQPEASPLKTLYDFDVRGNLTAVTDGNGNVTTYGYDVFSQVTAVTTPDTGLTSYTYTPDGLVASVEDARQHQVPGPQPGSFTVEQVVTEYDELRRPLVRTAVDLPLGAETVLQRWEYGTAKPELGRLKKVRVAAAGGFDDYTYTYDAAGRVASETSQLQGLSRGLTVGYGYLPGGLLGQVDYPEVAVGQGAQALQLTPGADDEVRAVSFAGRALATGITHFPFSGGLHEVPRGNGVTTTYLRDVRGLVSSLSDNAQVLDLAYGYSAAGNVDSVTGGGLSRAYAYDLQQQLEVASYTPTAGGAALLTEVYSYDNAGNRLRKIRNGKGFFSVFDMKTVDGQQVPANNLLRQVIDPPLDGGCAPSWPPVDGGDDDDGDECDDRHRNRRGRGHEKHCGEGGHGSGSPGHHRGGGHDDDDRGGHHRHHEGCGHGKHGRADAGDVDAGVELPVCPPPRTTAQVRALQKAWDKLLREAESLLRRLPRLTNAEAQAKLGALLESARNTLRQHNVSESTLLLLVLQSSTPRQGTFADALTGFLTRRGEGLPPTTEDVPFFEAMLAAAKTVPVENALAIDPVWTYSHDAAGNVTAASVTAPAVPGVTPVGTRVAYRMTYDVQQQLRRIDMQLCLSVALDFPVGSCGPFVALAESRYDSQRRRVFSRVAGHDTYFVYGPGGELLSEVDSAGEVFRNHVWLDGAPFALVNSRPSVTTRPPAGGGCSTSAPEGLAAGALLVLVLLARRRKREVGAAYVLLVSVLASTCGPSDEPALTLPDGGTVGHVRHGQPKDPVYFIHTDRLGTPWAVTDDWRDDVPAVERPARVVWTAEYRPFGDIQSLDADPDGDGTPFEQPWRFVGQYDDVVFSALFGNGPYFNWHRWYEPGTGRYLQSDPVLSRPETSLAATSDGQTFRSPIRGSMLGQGERARLLPSYAYALNVPTDRTDADGLFPGFIPRPRVCEQQCYLVAELTEQGWDNLLGCKYAVCSVEMWIGIGSDALAVGWPPFTVNLCVCWGKCSIPGRPFPKDWVGYAPPEYPPN